MEPGSPLRCCLVTLALPPDAASGRAGEKLGVEEGGEAFLRDLALSLSSSLEGPFPSLFPPLPFAFLKLILDLSGTLVGSLEQMWEVICSFSPG